MLLKEILDQIILLCIAKAQDAEFEKDVPERVVLLEDVMNVIEEYKHSFKGYEVKS